jgi:SGNH hydrolase-like domain, acetyltransferase AlgX
MLFRGQDKTVSLSWKSLRSSVNDHLLRRSFGVGLFSIYSIVLGWILVFLLIEFFPDILNVMHLQGVRYYALKKEYISDPQLVFVYRRVNHVYRSSFVGDLFSPDYKVATESIDYVARFNEYGFRKSSSGPPYDIAVIGDSYIEFGESDETIFTEILHRETGLSVLNLGRGWYGPYQYLELLKRYALNPSPKYVFFCFFAGNDFNDITQYEVWKAGGKYNFYRDLDNQSIISRFVLATSDVFFYLKQEIKRVLNMKADNVRSDLSKFGIIQIGNKKVPMVFSRWEKEVINEQLSAMKSIISEFKSICYENDIIPVLIYIPTATQVYAELYSPDSNSQFIDRVMNNPDNPSLQAIATLVTQLNIDFINLLPVFKQRAADGYLLYYPFDTHWNIEGRRTAASFIASYFEKR